MSFTMLLQFPGCPQGALSLTMTDASMILHSVVALTLTYSTNPALNLICCLFQKRLFTGEIMLITLDYLTRKKVTSIQTLNLIHLFLNLSRCWNIGRKYNMQSLSKVIIVICSKGFLKLEIMHNLWEKSVE